MKNNKIGLVGFGFVGQAMYANIKNKENVVIYDKFKNHDMLNNILETTVVFIQVPTPACKEFGVSPEHINSTLNFLSVNGYEGIVVIKSTILPMSFSLPKTLRMVSNPEFLNEVSAVDDFKNQKNILLGGDFKDCYEVQKVYEENFNLNCEFTYVQFEEALTFKYLRNIKIAYDAMFTNFMHDTTKNYRKYNILFEKFPLKPIHKYTIKSDGFDGVSGHCLPKDNWAYNFCYESKLTKFIEDYNVELKTRN